MSACSSNVTCEERSHDHLLAHPLAQTAVRAESEVHEQGEGVADLSERDAANIALGTDDP
jgi:hypothetical protein